MTQTSLVLELQQMASDPSVLVSSLLLKAKMVAVKLGLTEIVARLDHELTGYAGEMKTADLPQYRWTHGTLKVHNPYNGLCPIVIENGEMEQALTKAFIPNSVLELENSIKNDDSVFSAGFQEGQRKWLFKNVDHMGMPMLNVISKTTLIGIVASVRAAVLNWSLDLEQRGVMGHGLTFTPQEKQAATSAGTTINIGSIQTMQGILGPVAGSTVTQNLRQSVGMNDRESLRKELREVGIPESDIKELDKAIDAEPVAKEGKIGERVGAWIGGMAQKIVTGVWKSAKDKAIQMAVTAVNAYYGLGAGEATGSEDE